jgi:hypothetical protein
MWILIHTMLLDLRLKLKLERIAAEGNLAEAKEKLALATNIVEAEGL